MATSSLTYRHLFGLKGDVTNNIHYVEENIVAYPAGNNVVIYNTESRDQQFIPATEKTDGITALAVSNNKRVLAVAERAERVS